MKTTPDLVAGLKVRDVIERNSLSLRQTEELARTWPAAHNAIWVVIAAQEHKSNTDDPRLEQTVWQRTQEYLDYEV